MTLLLLVAALLQSPAPQDHAFLDQYCVTCHNERAKTAGLMLDKMTPDRAGENAEAWEKVVRKLRTGMMPPAGARRPDRATIDKFASNIESAIDRAASAKPNPGTTALHRLNRTEYANAVRDLLALPIDATALLPSDDSAEGFDNVADVLGVSPLLIQGYVSAATKVSRLAVGNPDISAEKFTYRVPRGLAQSDHIEGLPLGTRGGILIRHIFPLDGEYDFRITRTNVGVAQVGVGGDEEIEVSVDGERVYLLGRNSPRDIRLKMKAGPQSIGVAVLKKRNARGVEDLYDVYSASLGVSTISITGPFNATGPGDTASRRRIFTCRPATANDELPCARQILKTLARRAFRQPVNDSDFAMETLLAFYQTGRAQGTFDTGIEYALARILVNPRFTYRLDHEPANGAAHRVCHQLSGCHGDERIRTAQQRLPQARRTVQFGPIHELAGRIDRRLSFCLAPFTGEIEILQRESDGIHDLVTRCAAGIHAMLLHALAHRKNFPIGALAVFFQWRNVGGNRGSRNTKDIFENPLAARDRRCAIVGRRHHQQASFSQQPSPRIVFFKCDPAEMASANVRDSIVPRETLIDEGVIRVEQIDDASIFAKNRFKHQLHFTAERQPEILIELFIFRLRVLQVAKVQPLFGEIIHQRLRAWIGEHPLDLALEHCGVR